MSTLDQMVARIAAINGVSENRAIITMMCTPEVFDDLTEPQQHELEKRFQRFNSQEYASV